MKTDGTGLARFPARGQPAPPARLGLVRGMPHTYEMDAYSGYVSSNNPQGRWTRGMLARGVQPAFVGPSALGYFMWDPTDPNGWVGSHAGR